MNKYTKLFSRLSSNNEKAFIPFVILGDPNFIVSINIINTLIQNGADALELGVPFSDPVADGPVIQNGIYRALSAKINLNKCFEILKYIRNINKNIPIGLMIYINLIVQCGIEKFYSNCSQINVDSILIIDLPLEESLLFRERANYYNIELIYICPPNANNTFLNKISKYSTAYIYLLSRPGITGIITDKFNNSIHLINKIKRQKQIPILQGFNIFKPSQIHNILLNNIDGVIVGSAIIKIIEKHQNNQKILIKEISKFIQNMKLATYKC